MSLRSWFEKTFAHEQTVQARAERREVPGLEAIHWTGSSPGLDIVKNISSTGMYLVTRERWPEGEVNPIRLVYPELTDDSAEKQVTIETRTVRWGEDGMGLSFVLPDCMDLWLWQAGERVEPADILTEFRLSRALAFFAPDLPCGDARTEPALPRRAGKHARSQRHCDRASRRNHAGCGIQCGTHARTR